MDGRGPAWRVALEAAGRASVQIAPLRGMPDAQEAAALVARVWGKDVLDPALIRAFQHAGSVTLAARGGGRMVGFVLGFVGMDPGIHLHSHILGVIPDHRSRGVGYALKVAQRAASLDMGIDEIRWTYDPLVARNAWFNLVKLGTVATGFLPSFYGEMRDAVNRDDRSDRFEVRWDLSSDRVERALRGQLPSSAGIGPVSLRPDGDDRPTGGEPMTELQGGVGVGIPLEYPQLRQRDPARAAAWRDASASAFSTCFASGLVATWFSREGVYWFETP